MNNIKLCIFDLDGTLVPTKDIHYEALNKALKELAPDYVISKEDHLKIIQQ
jgi:beta-phosphoglucomutase-like phosphatase (HAD superfamily)